MALDDLIRGGIATAKAVLGDGLLPTVQHHPWDGASRTSAGAPSLGAAVSRPAVVEDVDVTIRDATGVEVPARSRVTFLEDVAVRNEDRIVLPDGRTGPILRIDRGVLDSSGATMLVQVYF